MYAGYTDTPQQELDRWELMKRHAAERAAAKEDAEKSASQHTNA